MTEEGKPEFGKPEEKTLKPRRSTPMLRGRDDAPLISPPADQITNPKPNRRVIANSADLKDDPEEQSKNPTIIKLPKGLYILTGPYGSEGSGVAYETNGEDLWYLVGKPKKRKLPGSNRIVWDFSVRRKVEPEEKSTWRDFGHLTVYQRDKTIAGKPRYDKYTKDGNPIVNLMPDDVIAKNPDRYTSY